LSFHDMAEALHTGLGEEGAKAKMRELPDWLVLIVAIFNPLAREAVPRLGIKANASNRKAREVLGWEFISSEDAIVASGRSLIDLGLIK